MESSRNDIHKFVEQVNMAGGSYHKIVLGDDLTLEGEYDMTKYLHYYNFPKDLTGKSVLDIGTSTGYFAFELERRHGQVTAIDIWDGALFNKIREILKLQARYIQKSIYDLDEQFGKFDLVFCGSLLLHLSDVFAAIQKIYAVCREEAVIATAIMSNPLCESIACCKFVGSRARDGNYSVYWTPNMKALKTMLTAAGFSEVEEISRFHLTSEPGRQNYSTLHGVIRAVV